MGIVITAKEAIQQMLELIDQCKEFIKLYAELAVEKPYLRQAFLEATEVERETIRILNKQILEEARRG